MSFTEQVKNELARLPRETKEERTSELLALLRMGGTVVTGNRRAWGLEFATGNSAVARRVLTCLKKDWGLVPTAMVRKGRKLRKKNVYTVSVPPTEENRSFLERWALGPFMEIRDAEVLGGSRERQAYLAGAFLGGGTVNRPQGDYHLEMVTRSRQFAESLRHAMLSFRLHAGLTDRKNDYIVYLKEGEAVGGFLQIVGAAQSYLDFESARVVKEMRNRVNRQVNCETANLQKTVDAAVRQAHYAERAIALYGAKLRPALWEACEIRLANPNASLSELSALCGISKSGLAHRFKRVEELVRRMTGGNKNINQRGRL